MSQSTGAHTAVDSAEVVTPRTLALVGLAVLTASYCSTLYWVTTIAGGTAMFAGAVAVGLGAGVLLRETEPARVRRLAMVGGIGAAVTYYLASSASIGPEAPLRALGDALAMPTGISVLRLAAVDVWIAALLPIPVFLSTYLALRGRYEPAVAAGAWLVLFLALTGDATLLETLVGTVGAAVALGFGELDRQDGSVRGAEVLVALLAVMAVLAIAVPVVPSGSADALDPRSSGEGDAVLEGPGGGDGGAVTLDEQLISGDGLEMAGPVNLSPDVRFVVQSESEQRWRVGTLDSYTGDGWSRIGQSRPYLGALSGPPGTSTDVQQRYELRADAEAVAAARYPVDVDGPITDRLQVTSTGSLTLEGRMDPGVSYTVESEVPDASASDLQDAGTDYPQAIERRYTPLPQGTVPDRVGNLTEQVTAGASTPYERSVAIESYLQENWGYSRNVREPEGTMADGLLFEMDAAYCTYFASTMATMLRTQDVPARVAVGYSSGQWVGNDTWVVRGTDAHAWVEVYFPGHGWMEFDPTPTSERVDSQRSVIEQARADENVTDVDVSESLGQDLQFDRPSEPEDNGSDTDQGGDDDPATNGTDEIQTNDSAAGEVPEYAGGYSGVGYSMDPENDANTDYVQPDLESLVDDPTGANETEGNVTNSSETSPLESGDRALGGLDGIVLALLLVAGTVAGGRRVGLQQRLTHAGRVLWQPRRGPEADAERAMDRFERILERRFEPRGPGETWREYGRRLPAGTDDRARRAIELHEQIRYAGDLDREAVDELVDLVDGLARSDLPLFD